MPKLVSLKQGTPEWKEWRKWKIGASMASAIMGVSPWQSPLQLWESILTDNDAEPNFAMKRGTRLEEDARKLLNDQDRSGLKYTPQCFSHSDIPWMIASMDGVTCSVNFTNEAIVHRAVEIKCPGREAHELALAGMVPIYYLPQLQHQMVICNLQEILYYSFDGEDGIGIVVARDDKYITEKLLPAEAAFYQSLIDFKPPEASDTDVIKIDDPGAFNVARKYKESLNLLKEREEITEGYKKLLLSYASSNRCQIGDVRISKIIRKGNVEYSKIPELKNVNLERYRKEPNISWRIS